MLLTKALPKFATKSYHHFCYEQVLGTTLEMFVYGRAKDAQKTCDAALAEIDRLESVYSRFKPDSELKRFLATPHGQPMTVSADLYFLLRESSKWVKRTGGAFHPGTDVFSSLWKQAELIGELPQQLEQLLPHFEGEFCRLEHQGATKLFPYGLNFNAIAKGLIVDRATRAALEVTDDVLLSIGGDVRHRGSKHVRVEVEEKAVDNAKHRLALNIQNQAVASSGSSRRFFKIKETSYSHILDPRTGQSVQDTIAVTVVAPDCLTADVLATAFNVMGVEQSLLLADELDHIGCSLVDKYGKRYSNAFFEKHLA
jgi:FAD:protein FMN transferase